MNSINIKQRTIGVNFHRDGEAEVLVWAPKASSVEIILPKNQAHPLKKEFYGYWTARGNFIKPGDRYKFRLDGEKERPDPASLAQPDGVHGFSEAIDLKGFSWKDTSWKNLTLQDYILYELHTGTFSEEGTFAGIEKKLDYLKRLGINAIEIMPVAQFPGSRNWGYDGVFPFATQSTYGGAESLRRLVNACHEKDIAVVLDVVYNHLGPEGNYFWDYGHYFTDKYHTPWGSAMNFDDAWCDAVRNYFIENALMWFRDFHIDALRMDAVHAIKDLGPVHFLKELKEKVNELMQHTGRAHYLIIECDLNDVRYINPLEEYGFGIDAQWIDEFHHALRVTAGEEKTGYYCDFDGINHLAKSYKDAYVYDGIYSPHRYRKFGSKAEKNPGKQFVVFSQNHDQVGNRMLGERTSQLVSFEMQKLLAGAVLLSPYIPMLFMGEEYGEVNPFQYFISHTDPELVEAVRKGRKSEFAAFHEKGEAPDPQSEETFNRSKLQWALTEKEPHKTLFRYYQSLILLRKHPALCGLNRECLAVDFDKEEHTLSLHRWNENNHIICLMNFSSKEKEVLVPPHVSEWKLLLNSADPQWKGPKKSHETIKGASGIIIEPESIIIYQNAQSGFHLQNPV